MKRWEWLLMASVVAFAFSLLAPQPRDLVKWQPVPTVGLRVQWQRVSTGWQARFVKTSAERRLLLLEAPVAGLANYRTLLVRYRLRLVKGQPPRLAAIAVGPAGAMWFRLGAVLPVERDKERGRNGEAEKQGNGEAEWHLPLAGFNPVAFRQDPPAFDPAKVQRLRVGLVLDGACEGVWEVREIVLSAEPFRPTRPLIVPIVPEASLSLAHHSLAKVKTQIVKGEGDRWVWRTEFVIVGGQHMWVLPSIPVPDADLTGYRGLQLTYRAQLPANIKALLVTLVERDGSHYYTDWLALPSAEWRTMVLPFNEFRLGGWSQDEDGQLDLDEIGSLIVGMHGTTSEREGRGFIEVAAISFVP